MKEEALHAVCTHCGRSVPPDALVEFDGQNLCAECLQEETFLCYYCGERIWEDENHGSDGTPLCARCYDNHYTHCTRCGRLLANDDARYEYDEDDAYCEDCYEESHGEIHDYSYRPEPIFYGDGNRFFGIELEIDGAGESDRNAKRLLEIGNQSHEFIYIKHDGSLNEGMEIVTHPMTLEFHRNEMPWNAIMQEAASMGYRSHSIGTCGLHLHVNRTTFGPTEAEQEPAIARILYFFEKHWEELLKFSRRTERQLKRWAARYGYKDRPAEILDHAKHGYGGRYTCVNLTNYDTIEFRMFRGTLKYNTLIATLQMVDHICDVALFLSDEELRELSWTSFVGGLDIDKYPELITYLKERRLYVNDAVESEAEL